MSSVLRVFRNKDVSLFHRCSVCGCPVTSNCRIFSFAAVSYEFASAKAQSRAEQTAENEINLLIDAIASCRNNARPLGAFCTPLNQNSPWTDVEATEIDNKTAAAVRIIGLNAPCPYCGNLEPWKKNFAQPNLRSLPPESFPKVYESSERADLEALLYLQSVLEQNEELRRDEKRFAEARAERERLRAEKEAAETALEDGSVQRQIDALAAQKAQLENELHAAGLFAFKVKKDINERMEELSAKAEELQKQEKKRKAELAATIRKDTFALERSDPLFATTAVKVETCLGATSTAVRLYAEPRD